MTSDGYHRVLSFLILDLHKSEVGPSNLLFVVNFFFFVSFLFKNYKKKKKKKISAGLSTPLHQG